MEEIINKYPSICYSCSYARKPASDENTKNGYVGCCMRVLSKRDDIGFDWDQITKAEVIAEGWVDLKSEPKLGRGSGMITNLQIITKGVKVCKLYEKGI